MSLDLPSSPDALAKLQRDRLCLAVARARRAPFHAARLAGIDPARAADDPAEWARIPILDKDQLRAIPVARFQSDFAIADRAAVVEYWRSGGTTGRPLFYPRSAGDIAAAMTGFRRAWRAMGATPADCVQISFPLGIHPVASMYARAAEAEGLATLWTGGGTNTPSAMQLQLIQELKPTIWAGMASYALHLANLAEAMGIDLAASTVDRILLSAEPLSEAKRAKIERAWGARVFDSFGMTEGGLMCAETDAHDGMPLWTDLFHAEVVDEATHAPLPPGEVGALVMTPLWTNSVTPFLRWMTGDIVRLAPPDPAQGDFAIFPVLHHARRTAGFFKVRGVNIGHAEYEDLVFRIAEVTDFKAEAVATPAGDAFRVSLELRRGSDAEAAQARVVDETRAAFGLTPELVLLATGTLAREFEAAVKAPRFVDRREER